MTENDQVRAREPAEGVAEEERRGAAEGPNREPSHESENAPPDRAKPGVVVALLVGGALAGAALSAPLSFGAGWLARAKSFTGWHPGASPLAKPYGLDARDRWRSDGRFGDRWGRRRGTFPRQRRVPGQDRYDRRPDPYHPWVTPER